MGNLQPIDQIQPAASFYKVLLQNSYAHLFTDCLWLFAYHSGRVEQLQQSSLGPKA